MEIAKQIDSNNSKIPEGYIGFFNSPLSSYIHLCSNWNVAFCRKEY
jgi:hypothetical protein